MKSFLMTLLVISTVASASETNQNKNDSWFTARTLTNVALASYGLLNPAQVGLWLAIKPVAVIAGIATANKVASDIDNMNNNKKN